MTAQEWLSSDRDFNTGVEIYNQLGTNSNIKRLFRRGKSPYTFNKLVYELECLAGQHKPSPTIEPSPNANNAPDWLNNIIENKYPAPDLSKLPQNLIREHTRKGKLYQEASWMHAQLSSVNDDQRLQYARKIVENFEQIDAIHAAIDYYTKHGKQLPVIKAKAKTIDIETASREELQKFLVNNVRPRISKLKTKPHRVKDYESLIFLKQQIEDKLS